MDEREDQKDLRCLRCGGPMEEYGRKLFHLGEEGLFGPVARDGWMATWLEADVLRCAKCGRAEFFIPEPQEEQPRPITYWCDYCQEEREDRLCPVCHRVGSLMEDHLAQLEKEKNQPPEPPEPVDRIESERRFPWQKKKVPWEK